MNTNSVDLGDDLVELLREVSQPVEQTARELIVLELYRQNRISAGKGSELLGISRWEFIIRASDAGIPYFSMTPDEWESEARQSEAI
jgi:predicted HTH domain antitoxin